MQTPTVALVSRQFVAAIPPGSVRKLQRRREERRCGEPFGVAAGRFPVTVAAGKKVRFAAHRTDTAFGYRAYGWWRVTAAGWNEDGSLHDKSLKARTGRSRMDALWMAF
jgi:hypothetical protein